MEKAEVGRRKGTGRRSRSLSPGLSILQDEDVPQVSADPGTLSSGFLRFLVSVCKVHGQYINFPSPQVARGAMLLWGPMQLCTWGGGAAPIAARRLRDP